MLMPTLAIVLALSATQVPPPSPKARVKVETGRPWREVAIHRATELFAGSACGVGGMALGSLAAVGVSAAVVGINVALGHDYLAVGSVPLQVPIGTRDDRLLTWVLLIVPSVVLVAPLGELAGFTVGALLVNLIPWPGSGLQRLGRASLAPMVAAAVTVLSMGAFACLGVYGFSMAMLPADGTFAGVLAAIIYLFLLAILLPPAGLLLGACTLGVLRPAALLSMSAVEAWMPETSDDGAGLEPPGEASR